MASLSKNSSFNPQKLLQLCLGLVLVRMQEIIAGMVSWSGEGTWMMVLTQIQTGRVLQETQD